MNNQMDKTDSILLKQDSIDYQSLKTEETIGYQSRMSNNIDM
jgi:hypothetical protein